MSPILARDFDTDHVQKPWWSVLAVLLVMVSLSAAEMSSTKDKLVVVPAAGLTAAELATAPGLKNQRDQLVAQRFFDHFTFGQDAPDARFV